MGYKTVTAGVALALFFLITPRTAHAQKDGEAQAVIFDQNNWPTLKFSDKRAGALDCGLFVSYALTDNQEEAFAIRVAHMHYRPRFFRAPSGEIGGDTLPEAGWLLITPSRITFLVEEGDKSHAFDVPRTGLKNKPVRSLDRYFFSGLQINLSERLVASNSREQKFVFLIFGGRGRRSGPCVSKPGPYHKLLKRAVNDFNRAMAEFKQAASSLKQAGKIQRGPVFVVPPANY